MSDKLTDEEILWVKRMVAREAAAEVAAAFAAKPAARDTGDAILARMTVQELARGHDQFSSGPSLLERSLGAADDALVQAIVADNRGRR